jgi:hypothetical protein
MHTRNSHILVTSCLCLIFLALGWTIGRNFSIDTSTGDRPGGSNKVASKLLTLTTSPEEQRDREEVESAYFSSIDYSQSTADLLQQMNEFSDPAQRQLYLRNLVTHWLQNDPSISNEVREEFLAGILPGSRYQTYGYEALFSRYVSLLSDGSIREAWKDNFANHPARSDIYSLFLLQDMANTNPENMFETSDQWNP